MRIFPLILMRFNHMQNGIIPSRLVRRKIFSTSNTPSNGSHYHPNVTKPKSAVLTWRNEYWYRPELVISTVIAQPPLDKCYLVVTEFMNKLQYIYKLGRSLGESFRQKSHSGISRQYRNYFITRTNFSSMSKDNISGSVKIYGEDAFKPREIKFPNSYGHVACLEWGRRDAPNKILCVHGWLDNAGSFERLIPCILKHGDNIEKYHVVAMDMPGVGHSSHRPPGSEYTMFSNVIEMRRITQRLGWNQDLILLAHSLGGHLSFLYSCIYSRQVGTFISIDTTHPITHQVANWNVSIENAIEHYFKCENYGQQNDKLRSVVPLYSEEDALKRLMHAHGSSLTYESAKVMFKRGATKHENGTCTFNRDVRHRHPSVEFRPTDDMMLKLMEGTFRPTNLMIIRASRSPYHRPEMRAKYYELYGRNCKLFKDILMEGTHHVHMNSPEEVGSEICKFLELAQSKASQSRDNSETQQPSTRIDKPNL